MKILSRRFAERAAGLPSWAALDEEALRLGSALEHVGRQGNLDHFSGTQSEKLALMAMANRRGLVKWNRDSSRYELTSLGRQQLGIDSRVAEPVRPARSVSPPSMQVRPASPFSPGALLASAACVVLGVAVMAATLRSFEVALENPAIIPNKMASHQDSLSARRIDTPGGADHATAPAPASRSVEQPAALPPTRSGDMHGTPAQPGPDSVAAPPRTAGTEPRPTQEPPPTRSQQVDETIAPIPHSSSRHSTEASEPIGQAGHHSTREVRSQPARPYLGKGQHVAQGQSGAEARSRNNRSADSGHPHGWASGKTLNVTRRGLLVREERRLADGSVLVRYQYGNGPTHFETRPKSTGDRAVGYAYAAEHLPLLGRFDWLR